MDSGMCMEADLQSAHADLVLINSKLFGLCQLDDLPVKPIPGWWNCKIPKYSSDTRKIAVIILKFDQCGSSINT